VRIVHSFKTLHLKEELYMLKETVLLRL